MSKLANIIVDILNTHSPIEEAEWASWASRTHLDNPRTTRQGVRDLGGNHLPHKRRETCRDEKVQQKLDRYNSRRREEVQKERKENARTRLAKAGQGREVSVKLDLSHIKL